MRPLRAALGFLTVLPVAPPDLTEADLGRSLGWFPAAGLVLGLAAAGAALAATGADPDLIAVGVVALLAVLTGGLHLDGVADVADGLAGGRGDRARTLAIMRDSRIGAIGAIALVLVLLGKVHAIAVLVDAGVIWPLIVAPVAARWAVVTLFVLFPYVRAEGVGAAFHRRVRRGDVVLATAIAGAVIVASGLAAAIAAAAAVAAGLAAATWIHHRVGGLTGDAYGAAIELAEVFALVAATAIGRN